MYFSNRTLPKISTYRDIVLKTLEQETTQHKYKINVQNIFVFYTQAFGIISLYYYFCSIIYLIYIKKINFEEFILFL